MEISYMYMHIMFKLFFFFCKEKVLPLATYGIIWNKELSSNFFGYDFVQLSCRVPVNTANVLSSQIWYHLLLCLCYCRKAFPWVGFSKFIKPLKPNISFLEIVCINCGRKAIAYMQKPSCCIGFLLQKYLSLVLTCKPWH